MVNFNLTVPVASIQQDLRSALCFPQMRAANVKGHVGARGEEQPADVSGIENGNG